MANSVLANMSIVLGANIKGFEQKMAVAKKELRGFAQAGEKLADVGKNMSMYLTAPLTLVGGLAVRAAGDLEALEKGFAATYKGAGDLNEELRKTREVAKLPGLGLKEAIQGATNLQAVGFAAEESRGILMAYGNALATVGKGKADLDGVVTALSQMSAKGKVSAEEINQIAERVPQIRKVMQEAFGTADTEELQKMGISVEQFVARTTAELKKLPTVAGGINNAFENMSDAGFLALTKLGNAIDKSFNLQGVFDSISDAITNMAEKFDSLSPNVQRTILVVTGLVAAAGPLALAIGSVAAALPALTVGFAALTGPIGLAVAAIAGGALLIISNWDTIKAYFTSGGGAGIFNKVKEIAVRAFDTIKAASKALIGFLTAAWDAFGGVLIGLAKYAWENVSGVINGALDFILAAVDVWKNLFQGNWSALWDSLINFVKVAANTIIDIFAGVLTALPRMVNSLFQALGMENRFAAGLDEMLNYVKGFVQSVKFETKGLDTVFDITAPGKKKDPANPDADPDLKPLPNAQLEETKKILKGLQSEFDLATKKFLTYGSTFDVLKEKSGVLENAINSLLANGFSPQSAIIQKLKGQLDALNNTGLDTLKNTFTGAFDFMTTGAMKFADAMKLQLQAAADAFKPLEQKLPAMSAQMSAFMEANVQAAEEAARQAAAMTDILQNAVGSVFAGMGDSLGNLFAGLSTGAGAIEEFGNTVLSAIADFAGQLGKYLIALGVAKMGLDNLFKAGPAGAAAAIGAGVALMALSKVVGSFAAKGPNFGGSAGGLAPSATASGSAYRQPNMGTSYGQGGETLRAEIEGDKLVMLIDRVKYKSGRLRG